MKKKILNLLKRRETKRKLKVRREFFINECQADWEKIK